MIKIVEPDHRPETQAPHVSDTCGCSCACNCATGDQAGNYSIKSPKSDIISFPVIHGKRDGA